MDITVNHDSERREFTAQVDGDRSVLVYHPSAEKVLDFVSTVVPMSQRHQGIGRELVKFALEYAREHGYRVRPVCPFVQHVVDEHPEYADVLTT
jgi:uncharacterized protein